MQFQNHPGSLTSKFSQIVSATLIHFLDETLGAQTSEQAGYLTGVLVLGEFAAAAWT